MAESLHCSSETTTALLTGYTPIQNKKFKVWKKNKPAQSTFSSFPQAPHQAGVSKPRPQLFPAPPPSLCGGRGLGVGWGGWEEVAPWSDRHSQDLTQYPPPHQTAAAAKSLQSCPTLCDPTDRSPPGSPVPGILQARTQEWVTISFSNARKWKVKVKSLSRVRLRDPTDCSPPGSSVHGIFQARAQEWVAISFSKSEVAQPCLTLRDPTDCSLPGSSVHGIFQARGLEWGAIAFSAPPSTTPYLLS